MSSLDSPSPFSWPLNITTTKANQWMARARHTLLREISVMFFFISSAIPWSMVPFFSRNLAEESMQGMLDETDPSIESTSYVNAL